MTRTQILMIVSILCGAAMLPFIATASEQVIVIVKTFPGEDRESELQARSLKQIEFLRKAEPTATFRLYRSAKRPTTFLWYEVYESRAAHENHLKVVIPSFRKELGPPPKGLMAKPPEIETYIELAK